MRLSSRTECRSTLFARIHRPGLPATRSDLLWGQAQVGNLSLSAMSYVDSTKRRTLLNGGVEQRLFCDGAASTSQSAVDAATAADSATVSGNGSHAKRHASVQQGPDFPRKPRNSLAPTFELRGPDMTYDFATPSPR